MRQPTVSVVMPNYNHSRFLPEALGAILSQSYRPLEVIIIDDGSTDNSIDVIKHFAHEEPLIRWFRNDRNRGVVYTINRGVGLALGDYVFIAAADDRVLPDFLRHSMELLSQYPAAGLSCCHSLVLDDATQISRSLAPVIAEHPRYFSPEELAERGRRCGFTVGSTVNAVVVKRSALQEVGEGDNFLLPPLRSACDFFAMNVIAYRYGICYVPQALAVFRKSSGSYSSASQIYAEGIVKDMLNLLLSPKYQDVVSHFQRADILYYFEVGFLRAVFSDFRRYRGFLTVRAFRRTVLHVLRQVVWGCFPETVYDMYSSRKRKLYAYFAH